MEAGRLGGWEAEKQGRRKSEVGRQGRRKSEDGGREAGMKEGKRGK